LSASEALHALIPAAGRSVRFGGTTPKQYARLAGSPVLSHSIRAVSSHPLLASVTVALARGDDRFEKWVRPDWPGVHTVEGGDSRARTVLNGLEAILTRDASCRWVLVHDAARPCLSRNDLERLVDAGLSSRHGAILARPVHDTLKWADPNGCIERTIDRSRCWAAQTPQMFRARELADRLRDALDDGDQPTDEAAAMERAGHRPLLVPGEAENIKITGADDLALAEFILQRRGEENRVDE
jgi:2-C-methyl-D-erythritol 4-phosphate cytidylyltransferase